MCAWKETWETIHGQTRLCLQFLQFRAPGRGDKTRLYLSAIPQFLQFLSNSCGVTRHACICQIECNSSNSCIFAVDCPLFLRYPTRKKVDSSKNPAPRKILKCGAILGIPSNSNSHLEHISIIEEQTGNFFPLSTFFLVGWRCRVKDSLDPLTTIWTSIFDFCTNFA